VNFARTPARESAAARLVSRALSPAVACLILAAAGCTDDTPFDYIPASGRLTYDDGTPIPAKGIRLTFQTQDVQPVGDMFPRPGDAEVDEQGNFDKVTSHKYGDGLVPGKHKVAIFYAVDAQGKLLIPQEYARPETTPIVVDTANLPMEIKVPRPGAATGS
jgi:hypothetical protein